MMSLPRKPLLSLHPLTVNEALAISLGAGPLPEQAAKHDKARTTSMQDKERQYFVGKVSDFARGKGWFFGSFMDERLLHSDLVEVAWQHVSNVKPSPEQKHLHKQSVEINIVLAGWVQITINGTQHRLSAGECYVV
jgi:mannose-6-phosphate isomerase-like protein (cupin superfamily)